MTQQRARAELIGMVDELWSAVGELVLIALEDAPRPSDLAVVDDLVDSVSGLQGHVAACRHVLAPDSPTLSGAELADLQHQLAAASLQYWRGIRAYEPVAQLRRAARARGSEWTAWFGSVQESAARCEAPLCAAAAACDLAWSEFLEAEYSPPKPGPQARHPENPLLGAAASEPPGDHATDPMQVRRTP
jgi:hypothetical protein